MTKALFMSAAMGAGVVTPTYVDDVFSTYLLEAVSGTNTVTNGINLSGSGGMVWMKKRPGSESHVIKDSARGANRALITDLPDGDGINAYGPNSFLSDGFSALLDPTNYVFWTFRKAPKFFDVVTWTGNGSNRTIAHSLGVAPGCIMVKRTDTTSNWQVYHRSLANTDYLVLNSTAASATGTTRWNSTTATSSVFSLGTATEVNASGGTYVAYVFAHDTATDGLIQCGSVTVPSSGGIDVTLGWEPQYLLLKSSDVAIGWYIFDTMRGFSVSNGNDYLLAESSAAEADLPSDYGAKPLATGFNLSSTQFGNASYVYIAIRRPNKPPTVGTQVFGATTQTAAIDASNPVTMAPAASDLWFSVNRASATGYNLARLSGWGYTFTDNASAETAGSSYSFQQIAQDKLQPNSSWWGAGTSQINWFLKRAPGFFDVVCDTGTGSAHTVAHNLGVVPELILRKGRSGATDWQVYCANLANTEKLVLNSTAAKATDTAAWNSTTPTASVFTVGTGANVNTSTATYISYLFATLAGISKVGSYTGNGSNQTINCGFTTGARFVLIKRTNTTGDWFVWDTARGIVSGNDPHLSLNTTAAEVTTDDTIDPDTSGFIVNQVAATNVNVNAATYIYLAIA